MAQTFYAQYPSSAAGSNPSVGPNGSSIPTESTLIGGENPSGNLQPLQTDASGNLFVNVASESGMPFSVNLTEVAGTAITLGQTTMSMSLPVAIASDQSTLPISAASLPLPTGAATAANQATEISSLSTIATNTTGVSTAANQTAVQSAIGSSASTAVTIQGSVSGVAVPVSLGSVPLPTGAATAANQTNGSQKTQIVDGSGNVIASTSNALNVQVENFPATQPVSGTVTANQGTAGISPWLQNITEIGGTALALGQTTMSASIPVAIASDQSPVTVAQSTAANLNATVVQGTAANLNATVVQGTAANLKASVNLNDGSGTSISSTSNALNVHVQNTSIPQTIAGTASANAPVYNDYSSTNITTSAYVQLVATTSNTINTIHIFDSSGQAMILGVGGPGSEVIQIYVPPGGDTYTLNIPSGSRIAYKALTATANSGYLLMSFLE